MVDIQRGPQSGLHIHIGLLILKMYWQASEKKLPTELRWAPDRAVESKASQMETTRMGNLQAGTSEGVPWLRKEALQELPRYARGM